MKVVRRRPPFYWLICLFIGTPPVTAIYTYGRTIYSPAHTDLPLDLIAHEATHREQQGRAPWWWWARYLLSPRFRIEQERQAYRRQLRTFPKSSRALIARDLAQVFASPLYGDGLTFKDAYAAITKEAA